MSSAATTGRTNRLVVAIIRSRVHWLLSRWVCVIEYHGRRSGRRFVTPTQYADAEGAVIILVGNHTTKSWWRNFAEPGHPMGIHIRGVEQQAIATAFEGHYDTEQVAELLDAYVARYPRAAKLFDMTDSTERARSACLVRVELA